MGKRRISEENRKKREQNFIRKLKEVHGDKISYIKGYVTELVKCLCKCNTCGHEFWVIPQSILYKSGCPMCAINAPVSKEEAEKRILEKHGGKVQVINWDNFKNVSSKLPYKCRDCGYEWEARVYKVYNGNGCPNCAGNLPVSKEELIQRVHNVYPQIEILNQEAIKGVDSILKYKCGIHGCEWEACIYDVYTGNNGCKECCLSKLEKPIYDLLKKKNCIFEYDEPWDGCKMLGSNYNLRPDFRFLNAPLIFELDGSQHLVDIYNNDKEIFIGIKERDEFKNKYYKKQGYITIRAVHDSKIHLAKGNYITLTKIIELINKGITDKGEIDLNVFIPFDFNRI